MRLSADIEDRGYTANTIRYVVTLDGVRLYDCITADEEEGTVLVAKRGADGRLLLRGNIIERELLKGAVKIKRWRSE